MRPLVVFALLAALAAEAGAQGIVLEQTAAIDPRTGAEVRAPEELRLQEHSVRAEVEDRLARVEVTQTFLNPNGRTVEGVYLFPLPAEAGVTAFALRAGRRELPGDLVEADRAREIYRSIVHRRRDPGLLEYAGDRLLRARIFPIPAHGEMTVVLRYEQEVPDRSGTREVVLPLRARGFDRRPVPAEGVVEVRASSGVAALFSPTHRVRVQRHGAGHATVRFGGEGGETREDLRLLIGTGGGEVGLGVAAHRDPEQGGAFLLSLAPRPDLAPERILPKDLVLVVDTSASMGNGDGARLRHARTAAACALGRLRSGDRFNIVAFASAARAFRPSPVPLTRESFDEALDFLDSLRPAGGSALHDALVLALRGEARPERPVYLLVLTDGEATVGPAQPAMLVRTLEEANRMQARVFTIGIGAGVDAPLLCELAEAGGGVPHFVFEADEIRNTVDVLCEQISRPVLTGVRIEVDGVGAHDLLPARVSELFLGQTLLVAGRYRTPGTARVRVSGRADGRTIHCRFDIGLPARRQAPAVLRLWAARRLGALLDAIRRDGESEARIEEVRRLGSRYGILTPYTAYLALEARDRMERLLGDESVALEADDWQAALTKSRSFALWARELLGYRGALHGRIRTGAFAFGEASHANALRSLRGPPPTPCTVAVDGTSFRPDRDGVWIDTRLDRDRARWNASRTVRVRFLSDAYMRLLEDDALARLLSIGPRVRLVHEGIVYEVLASP